MDGLSRWTASWPGEQLGVSHVRGELQGPSVPDRRITESPGRAVNKTGTRRTGAVGVIRYDSGEDTIW